MSLPRTSVLALLGLLGLAGCAPEPVRQETETPAQPPPAETPPGEPSSEPPACQTAPRMQWVQTFPEEVSALATDSRTNIAFVLQTLEGAAPAMLDSSGARLWTRPSMERVGFRGLSVAPSGALLAWGWRDGVSGPGGGIGYTFGASGDAPTVFAACGDECSPGPFSMDAAGNILRIQGSSQSSWLGYIRPDGHSWSILHSYFDGPFPADYPQTPLALSDAVFDAEGNVLAAGTVEGQGTFQGQPFGAAGQSSPVALKLSPRGELLWSWELPTARAFIRQVATSESGALVALGRYTGPLKWPEGELRTTSPGSWETLLLALDAKGRLAWAQNLPHAPHLLAVSPSGRIAVASVPAVAPGTSRTALHVREYDPQGNLRWSHTWTPLDASGSIYARGLAWSGEALVLGGSFQGAVDLGTGPLQGTTDPRRADGFILKLQQP